MMPFDKSECAQGKSILLRAAVPADAPFVFEMRSNAAKARFLHPVRGTVDDQRAWLERSHADPAQLYFVICSNAAGRDPLGLVRIYDPQGDSFCWGSWLIREGAPATTAIESALLVYRHALQRLGFTQSHFDVRVDNHKVIRFHEGFGAVEVRRDDTDVFFRIGSDAIHASLHKFRRHLPTESTT